MIVESYFFCRSVFIIWPKYFAAVAKNELDSSIDENEVSVLEESIQLSMAVIVIFGICWSYLSKIYKFEPIKWLLWV
jgi:hypothetical protein